MAKSKKKNKKRNQNKPRKTICHSGIFSIPMIHRESKGYEAISVICELVTASTFFADQCNITIPTDDIKRYVEKAGGSSGRGHDWNAPGMMGRDIAKNLKIIEENYKKTGRTVNCRCEKDGYIYRAVSLNSGCLHLAGINIDGLFIIRYNESKNVAECFCIGTDGTKTGFFEEAMLFLSPDPATADAAAQSYYNTYKGKESTYSFDPYTAAALVEAIAKIPIEEANYEPYHAGKLETDIYKALYNDNMKDDGSTIVRLNGINIMHKILPNKEELFVGRIDSDENNTFRMETNDIDFPLLDMSVKEINYIKNYFSSYTDPVDLRILFDHPRYGNATRIEHVNADGVLQKFFMGVGITGDDEAVVMIDNDVDDSIRFHTIVLLYNIDDYQNPAHNICGIDVDMQILNENAFVGDFAEPMVKMHYDAANARNMFEEDMYRLVHYLIKVYLVMHDRPKRYRIITVSKNHDESQPTTSSESKEQIPNPKPYVIRRLLRPAKEAEEYIRTMNKRKEVVYTMESWHRCGYWRRVPGSDRKVYIPPTTCHRNLKVTKNTDIHIKL